MTFSFSSAERTPPAGGVPYAWPLALAVTTVAGSLVASCLMPFVAIAVMAAATLPLRSALLTVLAAWAANQLIGFSLLGFPMDAFSLRAGASLLIASLVALLTARVVVKPQTWSILRIGAAFLVGVTIYETLLYGYALVAGDPAMFTPAIVALVVATDGIWCAILVGCHLLLTGLAPKVFGAAPKLRLA
jgi:hypothetical protein